MKNDLSDLAPLEALYAEQRAAYLRALYPEWPERA